MSHRDEDEPAPGRKLSKIPQGALSRGVKTGRALLGALGRAAGERLLGDGEATGSTAGEGLATALGHMKGLSMKLGQMLSYVDLQAPEGFRHALARLQHESIAMTPEVTARVIEEDLGKAPLSLFSEWDPEPLAAASIGQVHRARLFDGRQVAVKVRYPEVEHAVKDDLKNLALMPRLLGVAAPALDTNALFAELRERFLEECDYRLEAANQRKFREFFQTRPGVVVPEVYDEYSSERVLTMELIEGQRFEAFSKNATEGERDRAARVVHDFAFESIFRMGALNCDPHPGNYLFTSRGVAFLDFGCVRRFSDTLVSTWKTMLRSALERDRTTFENAVLKLGLASERRRFDFDAHYESYLFLIRPWLTDESGILTPEHVAHTYRALLVKNPNRARLNMPRELLFANRLQWGLYSVLADLNSNFSFRRAILDILYEPGEPRPDAFSDSELRRYLSAYQRRR